MRPRAVRSLLVALFAVGTLALPSSALAADTATAGADVGATSLVTSEAPAELKAWAAEREAQAPKKTAIAIALIVVMTLAGATASYLMTKRLADADRMTGDAHNRWMRDRNGGKWSQWGR